MNINELNLDGYKHIMKNNWEMPENLFYWLSENKFKEIGNGRYSKIYSSETEKNFIVKINKGKIDKEYLYFVDFCHKNKGNPHLPKMGQIKKYDDWYILFIEKLEYVNAQMLGFDNQNNFFNDIKSLTLKNFYFDSNEVKIEQDYLIKKYPNINKQLFTIAEILAKILKQYNLSIKNFDLHDQNLMMRGDIIVITDPLWEN